MLLCVTNLAVQAATARDGPVSAIVDGAVGLLRPTLGVALPVSVGKQFLVGRVGAV